MRGSFGGADTQAGTDTPWRAGYPMEGPIVFEAEVLETRL